MCGFCDSLRELADKDVEMKILQQQQRQREEQEHQQKERLQTGLREVSGQEVDEYAEEKEKSKEKEVPEELMLREVCSINCPRLRLICSICNVCARFTMCGWYMNGTCEFAKRKQHRIAHYH